MAKDIYEIARDKCDLYGVLAQLNDENRLRRLFDKVKYQLGNATHIDAPTENITTEVRKKWKIFLLERVNSRHLEEMTVEEGENDIDNVIALAIMKLWTLQDPPYFSILEKGIGA